MQADGARQGKRCVAMGALRMGNGKAAEASGAGLGPLGLWYYKSHNRETATTKILCWGMWGQQSASKSLVTAVVSGSVRRSGLFTDKPTQRFHFGDCPWEEHAVGSSCLRGLWVSDRGGTSPSCLPQQSQLEEAESVKTSEGWFRSLRQIMARPKFHIQSQVLWRYRSQEKWI